jgi:hypothetical protein
MWELREEKKIAGGGETANQKNNRGEGAMAWFRPGEKN